MKVSIHIFLFYFNGIEYRFVNVDIFKFDCSQNLEILEHQVCLPYLRIYIDKNVLGTLF